MCAFFLLHHVDESRRDRPMNPNGSSWLDHLARSKAVEPLIKVAHIDSFERGPREIRRRLRRSVELHRRVQAANENSREHRFDLWFRWRVRLQTDESADWLGADGRCRIRPRRRLLCEPREQQIQSLWNRNNERCMDREW